MTTTEGTRERTRTYQLDLLGAQPKAGKPWRPRFFQWRFCGIPVPLDDDAVRQVKMLTRETQPDAFQEVPRV